MFAGDFFGPHIRPTQLVVNVAKRWKIVTKLRTENYKMTIFVAHISSQFFLVGRKCDNFCWLYAGYVVWVLGGIWPGESWRSRHQYRSPTRPWNKPAEEETRQSGQLHVGHDGDRVWLSWAWDEHGHHRRVLLRSQDLPRARSVTGKVHAVLNPLTPTAAIWVQL